MTNGVNSRSSQPRGRKLADAARYHSRSAGSSSPSASPSAATGAVMASSSSTAIPGGAASRSARARGGAAASTPSGRPVQAAGTAAASRPSKRSDSSVASHPSTRSASSKASQGPSARRRFNYPRAGKGPVMRWLPSWRFWAASFLLMIAALATTFIVAYNVIKVPAPSEFAQAQSTTVYYADGQTEMGTFAEVNRTIIDASTLPEYVGQAVVASEDRTFYTNNGVDPKGIARAFVNNLSGGATQGASTLTQQYIKNYYVDTTDSYLGKFQQAIMAIKIDRELSKQEILGSYLNTVYFGRGAYGIEAASQAYFGHPASELTVSESALLAGIMPAPSAWDPAVDADKAYQRWGRVLDFMLEDGYITREQFDAAQFPETVSEQAEQVYAGPTGYLLRMVRDELVSKAGMTEEDIDTGGYRIITTIDKANQDAAVASVGALPEGHSDNLRVALVSLDAKTGGIKALFGGEDYLTSQVNTATGAVAQAGSTFKPFALVAALENGATLSNGYMGTSPMTIDGATFQNYGNVSYGWSNLVRATAYSMNTPYLQLNRDVGPEVTNQVAVRAGYPQDTLGLDGYVQNVLGSASPHTIDIATAYATFAAQGTRHDTHIVDRVNNSAGDVAYTANTTGEKVFSDDVMADATYAMRQVVNEGSGTTALSLGRPVAAKTGSSSDNKSAQFVGYTPQIATAVTLYQTGPNGEEESITPWGRYSEITGSTYPADIFTTYMQQALAGMDVEYFPDRTAGSYQRGRLFGSVEQSQQSIEGVASDQASETASEEAEETDSENSSTSDGTTSGTGSNGASTGGTTGGNTGGTTGGSTGGTTGGSTGGGTGGSTGGITGGGTGGSTGGTTGGGTGGNTSGGTGGNTGGNSGGGNIVWPIDPPIEHG